MRRYATYEGHLQAFFGGGDWQGGQEGPADEELVELILNGRWAGSTVWYATPSPEPEENLDPGPFERPSRALRSPRAAYRSRAGRSIEDVLDVLGHPVREVVTFP